MCGHFLGVRDDRFPAVWPGVGVQVSVTEVT